MRNLYVLLFVLGGCAFISGQVKKEVFGKITDEYGPLENVIVSIQGTQESAFSDKEGNYMIQAQEGDILAYELMGKLPMEIKVEDVTRVLNITLRDKVEKLSGVTVSKKLFKSQEQRAMEYDTNPNIIKNAFGYLDKETAGFSMRILDEKDFGPQYTDIGTLLNGRFAGVMAHCNRDTGEVEVSIRTNNTTYGGNTAIYDVDGIIMYSLPCSLIDPSNIKKIGVIRGAGGAGLYGSNVMGGVVVINTKVGTFASVKQENYRNFKKRLDQESLFTGDAVPMDVAQPLPAYMELYLAAQSEAEAIVTYENQLDKYGNSFYFVLDSYSYFRERWDNKKFANSLLEDNWGVFENNPVALKSLAYFHQAYGDFSLAKEIYKEVFLLRPEYVQSYFNMAESYVENEQYNLATAMYTRFDYLKEEGFLKDERGDFSSLMDGEFNILLGLEGNDLLSKRQHKKLAIEEDLDRTRLVFEWADSEAEFELQFVNPENRYFTWDHTSRCNEEIIKYEKTLGYSTKEYRLGRNYQGDWQVNIKYLGNKSLTPTYLKVAVYRNYGKNDQTKETKVFKLSTKNINQHLFKVSNITGVAVN